MFVCFNSCNRSNNHTFLNKNVQIKDAEQTAMQHKVRTYARFSWNYKAIKLRLRGASREDSPLFSLSQ